MSNHLPGCLACPINRSMQDVHVIPTRYRKRFVSVGDWFGVVKPLSSGLWILNVPRTSPAGAGHLCANAETLRRTCDEAMYARRDRSSDVAAEHRFVPDV
jgi:hypothetical protein